MLHLIQSNKMAKLADELVICLQQFTGGPLSLFEGQNVLVQSPGMAQWLKLLIAEKSGIAANIHFPLPSSYIWELYRQHFDDLPEQSAFTKPNMTWKLMQILPQHLELESFASLKHYLNDGDPLKCYQLCHKIADVFDQYLVYRPEWIQVWEQGEDQLSEVDVTLQPWQPILWRALVEYSKAIQESPYHRANLHQGLMEKLQQSTEKATRPLFIFGISALPQQQLEVFTALAETTEVFIFWCNPSQHYWGDVVDAKVLGQARLKGEEIADYMEIGNPLLSSWGKLGRDYQDMLLNLDIEQHESFEETEPQNLLQHIQSEVLNLAYRGSMSGLEPSELLGNGVAFPKLTIGADDKSVVIHACHSKVRELEVLHDYLLHQFSREPTLSPADIIVMMPDVASYGPFIEGVFGSATKDNHIPFAISDRLASEESPLLLSFLQLMNLHHSRMTLSDVLALLEVPSLRQKFDISESEFELLKHWLMDAGVRWGWDQQDKSRWDLPADSQNTWMFGLDRLLAGYAIKTEDLLHAGESTVAPYLDIEGQHAVALGKFGQFSELLLDALSFCLRSESLQEKTDKALSLLDALYEVEDKEQVYANQLRQAIEQISSHANQYPEAINQDIFVAELQQSLSDKGVGQRFLAGSVNFCTLMPMRSIPFKLVCLLGMSDGDYPRQTAPIGFDLMRHAKGRKGDRSRRHDDRYLFLEALLSAEEKLFISYNGFSVKDNSELSPSILVSELVEYCQHCFALEGDENLDFRETQSKLNEHLHTMHYLQPFSAGYFKQSEFTQTSFNPQWCDVASLQSQPITQIPFFDQGSQNAPLGSEEHADNVQLELRDLISFFENPVKALFRARWQTSMDIRHEQLIDEEPFALDPLNRYQLNQRMVEQNGELALERLRCPKGHCP